MLALDAPRVITPMNGEILVTHEVLETSERIPFDVDSLISTPLENSWGFYHVAADQIEPIQSDWYRIKSAPGIYVAGSSYGTYRVAINESYLPCLCRNRFKFQYVDPMGPVDVEQSVQGKCTAAWNADACFVQDAIKAIVSECNSELVLTYRNFALGEQKLPIEWAILMRDLESVPDIRTKFAQGLVLIVLGCCDDYETPSVLALLRKNESELLQGFRSLYRQLSAYPRSEAGIGTTQISAEHHRMSLFRHLYEFFGGTQDPRQHNINPQYPVIDNAKIFGSVVDTNVFKPFRIFDSKKLLDVLSKSPLFPDETLHKLDAVKLSTQMVASLPIGFPNGYLDIPLQLQDKLSCEQANTIRAQIAHFYHEYPSLKLPRNNILVLLSWNSIRPTANRILIEWATSDDGLSVYKRIIQDIKDFQPTEQLVLALASLLSFQRLLPFTPNGPNQPIKGSYQSDFNAILNGENLGNERKVFEIMGVSILTVFYTVKDSEGVCQFLASVLHINSPVLDPFHGFSDQYWVCRLKHRSEHIDMASLEKMMAAVDNEEAQKEGRLIMALEDRLAAFPAAIFHLNVYKLVFVCLPEVPPHEAILGTISLPNNSSAIVVLKSSIPNLERDLGIKCFPYNIEPSKENVELLGSVEAQNQKINALARMIVDAISRDITLEKGLWTYVDPLSVLKLFTIWLEELASQLKRDPPRFLEPADIDNDVEAGRILLDGYDFNSYILVRVSELGQFTQTLDKLLNFDEVLSIEELQDGSWELPVCKSYLPTLKEQLHKVVPDCTIELDYDPTEPVAKEVEKFGYETAKILRTITFCERANRMMHESWPKAAAFYSELIIAIERDNGEGILENKEVHEEQEGKVEESTDEDWVIVPLPVEIRSRLR